MSDNFINSIIDKSEYLEREREYWMGKMAGEVTQSGLPHDNHLNSLMQVEKESVSYSFPQELSSKIIKLSNNSEQRLFTILSCGLSVLLYKYSGNEDILFGTPVFKKDIDDEVINLVLPIRNRVNGNTMFKDLLYEARRVIEEAITNQNYPISKVMEYAGIEVPKDCLAYFEIAAMLDSIHNKRCLDKVRCNLIFCFSTKDNGLELSIEYNPVLYRGLIVDNAAAHLINLLNVVLQDVALKIAEVEILGVGEKERILYGLNDTCTDYPKDKTIIELFEQQAILAPENVAIVDEDTSITYKELNNRANKIAFLLKEEGLTIDSVAGIMSEGSKGFIVGILGILKAGGAYLPIDASYPSERIRYMLHDSNAKVLLVSGQPDYKNIDFQGVVIDLDDQALYSGECSSPERINSPESLAYVIYTSGTTGKSKGVMITNKGLVNYVWWAKKVYTNGEKVDFPLYSSVSFDLTVTSIFTPLISGSKILIYKGQDKLQLIRRIIEENKAGIIKLTPTHLKLVEEMNFKKTQIKKLIVGGEDLKTEQAEVVYQRFGENVEIYNEYGPTETVVGCMIYRYNPETDRRVSVPIGKPADNVQIYILDRDLNPVPDLVTGEIYIAGDGVARGYINNSELTDERFVLNSFIPFKRMYKTGDLARRLENGNLEYVGRADRQVKIRGYRIELSEIENRLLSFSGMKQVVATMKEDNTGNKYICCYFVADMEKHEPELRNYLSRELPQYMIPAYFVQLESIPVSSNGKVEVNLLPSPVKTAHVDFVPPRDEIEEQLVRMWKDILKIDNIGVYNDFFEFGGHSLRATVLINRINKELNVEVPLGEIFREPTIAAIAQYIKDSDEKLHIAIQPAEEKEYYPASSAQKRLYILHQYEGTGVTYNTPVVMTVDGDLDEGRFEETVEKLVLRHEAFRTSFELAGEETVQKVHEKVNFKISYIEINESEIDQTVQSFIQPFDLSKAPLLRVTLAKINDTKHVLMFDMHHIITDGMSLNIMIKEFADFYKGMEIPELKIQYKDFCEWQYRLFKSGEINRQEEYWLDTFKGELPILDIPTDFSRPPMQNFEGNALTFTIDKTLAERLNSLALRTGATLYMVLLAAYNVLLSKYTGQNDIIVGSPVAGRQHADLENVIGMFVNTLAHRNYPKADKTFEQFLQEIKTNTIKAFDNQDYMFEELVEKLDLKRDAGRNPVFDTMFIMQNTQNVEVEIPGLVFSHYGFKKSIAKFDTVLTAIEIDNGIFFEIEYCTRLFNEETIKSLGRHFVNILSQIAEFPYKTISEIELLDDEEKNKLLDFNNTKFIYPKEKLLYEFFEEQADTVPNNVAVECEGISLTYGELNIRANRLAGILRQKGVEAGNVLGVMAEPSIQMMVGILGILKAGGAYLPISPDFPAKRIEFMLADSKVDILLITGGNQNKFKFQGDIIDLDKQDLESGSGVNLEKISKPSDVAVIIYTSGSTGVPKGVILKHTGIINHIYTKIDVLEIKNHHILCLNLNITFVASIWQVFAPLFIGTKLVIYPKSVSNDGYLLFENIEKDKVSIAEVVPSLLGAYLENMDQTGKLKLPILEKLILTGEKITSSLVNEFYSEYDIKLINAYGQSECSDDTMHYHILYNTDTRVVPIGKPSHNTQVYILNPSLQLQPVGIPGEIYISGDCLSSGYLNMPEYTNEKFIQNPFIDDARMFKTGDTGRWLPDGNVEYIGRIDHQLKIRGYRIEPGEIEIKLLEYPAVKEAVVIAGGDKNDTLSAYIVCEGELNINEIREFLSKRLPLYMVPQYYRQLQEFPLNSNGKVDRKALRDIKNETYAGVEYVAPQNHTQEQLALIWQDILKLDRVGINDNFFAVGGHSLKATKLVSRIFKEFNVKITLREVFMLQSIRALAECIENTQQEAFHAIKPVEERNYYPVSSAQKRMFTIYQMQGQGTDYNLPLIMAVEGTLDRERFEETIKAMIKRHEVFRTSFEIVESEPVQRIHQEVEFSISYFECTCDDEARAVIRNFVRPFDLGQAPLISVGLVRVSSTRHILICDMHHIITDGTSIGVIMYEFVKLYEGIQLPELKIQYKDFAVWQNNFLNTNLVLKQKEYWMNIFSSEVPVLNIPTDYPRPAIRSFEGDSFTFVSDAELTRNLNQLALETGTTLFMVFLSVYNIVLHKYSGQEDIIVGTGVAGRTHEDLNNIVGMFVNMLAMRNYPKDDITFREFLQDVRSRALEAYENQDYQFEELVENIRIKKDLSRNPLFDTVFAWQNMDIPSIGINGLNFSSFGTGNDAANFDFTLRASELDNVVVFSLNYCTRLFARETMEAMAGHILSAAQEIAKNPDVKLGQINILSTEEKQKLLKVFNGNQYELDLDKTITELFEQQVEKTPDNIALIYDDTILTYRELDQKANRLAMYLKEKGVGPETVVAVMVERSHDMAIAILGILKSGAAYMPVDFSYPEDRISYMLEDSGSRILVTQNHLLSKVNRFNGEIINLSSEESFIGDGMNLAKVNSSKDLAYIIYTSGTEGKPKGVMVEHRSISNTIQWRKNEYALNEADVVLQLFSHTFDGFLTSFFTPIVSGSSAVILLEKHSKDPMAMAGYIQKYKVTHFIAVPHLYDSILEYTSAEDLHSLRLVTLAGDKVSSTLVTKSRTKSSNIELINEYGPTENSVATTICRNLESDRIIFIGKSIANTKVYILGENNTLQPIGITGELCISGEGLARGYLNRPELECERFVKNPFEPGSMMYRTGDLARWHADGNIEFLGRSDYQVKIRGYRVELMEIENAIQQHPLVKQAVVLDIDDMDGDKSLYAFYVSDEDINLQELRECLSGSLPHYMLPSAFTRIDSFPVTDNGKIDRKALAKFDVKEPAKDGADFNTPQNKIEENLVKLWAKVLSTNEERISTTDDFFEIGGHSLRATALLNEIHKEFNVEVPLGQLFEKPTIKDLGEYIDLAGKTAYLSIEKAEKRDYYAVSAAQKRLYILDKLEGANTAYNIPMAMMVDGPLDIERLEETIKKLIDRHEALRTSFSFIDEEVVQIIHDKVDFEVELLEKDESEIQGGINAFIRPFDLAVAPLIRVALIKLSKDKHILMWDIHHIVTDGVTMGIITREFAAIYSGRELPSLRLQYKDFSEWQNSILHRELMDVQMQYWLKIFEGEIPLLDMPTDYPRPSVQSFEGDTLGFRIDRELVEKLHTIASETGTTNYMVILSIYNIMLSKYTGQEDIVVGTPIAGRHHADLEEVAGVFVNTLAMRNYPLKEYSFYEFLEKVRDNSLKAFQNQDYQFEDLVNSLELNRDMGRNPLFDTMFSLQNNQGMEISIDGLVFGSYGFDNRIAKFDLSLYAIEDGDNLDFAFEFCTRLYKRGTIKRMSDHFVNIIKLVTSNPEIVLSEIELISGAEKEEIIGGFNNTRSEYPREKTLNDLFNEQVQRFPNRVAACFGDLELTYAALNEKSNRLANMLRRKGVKPNTIVGIMMERSLEMMVGILGILKAGGAYMPIDPGYPHDRIRFMLENSEAGILLTQERYADNTDYPVDIINIENDSLYSENEESIDSTNAPGDLAYVIYTSGTTGKPKGVMIEHHAVINRLNWMQKQYCLDEDDVILQKTPYTFDVSVWELFWWFYAGAKVCFLKPGGEKDPDCIIETIYTNKITTLHFVPSMLSMFLEYLEYISHNDKLSSLKRVFASGEALGLQQVRKFNNLLGEKIEAKLYNLYGPTEATVDVSYFDCSEAENYSTVPIGKPIDNIKLLVLDKNKKLQPVGIAGDLYIAGAGLARGYLNNPELTEEKFIPNPYTFEDDDTPGLDRMYKNGDLARWLEDGNIEYLGRIDNQVKIRGFRIELGEIEKCIEEHENVKECIVVSRDDGFEGKQLIAYYTADSELLVSELYIHLSKTLPEYMIPNGYIYLPAFPVTSNGKVDRKALQALYNERVILRNQYAAPSTEIEKDLQGLWEYLLNIDLIGANDNFFEIGGNSLLAIKLHSQIEKKYPGDVKIADIFSYPTISKLALHIKSRGHNAAALMELDKMLLPDEYFTDVEQEEDILKVRFEDSVYDRLKILASRERVELPDILMSVFACVLSDASGLKSFKLHSAVHTDNLVNIMDIGLKDLEEIDTMLSQVNEQRLKAGTNHLFSQLDSIIVEKEKNQIIPLFVCDSALHGNLLGVYDIILSACEDNELYITCEFNASRLNRDKIEGMLYHYAELIQALSSYTFAD